MEATTTLTSKFGEPPQLSLRQKLILTINGNVFIDYRKTAGDYGYSPVYVVHCSKHGKYLDTPHGWNSYFSCNECLKEQKQKCLAPATVNI
jgi:hypothetical protein